MARIRVLGLVLGAALLTSSVASAAPLWFTLEPGLSSLSISMSSLALGSGSGSATVYGYAYTDLTAGVLTLGTNSLSVDEISLANGNWSGSGFFADLTARDLVAEIGMGDVGPVSEGDPGVYDLAGWTLSLINGVVAVSGFPLFTFTEQDPLSFTFEDDVLSVIEPGGPHTFATWTIPVAAAVTFETLGQVVRLEVSGILQTPPVVPEPGTLLLVSAGLAGLVGTARKRRA